MIEHASTAGPGSLLTHATAHQHSRVWIQGASVLLAAGLTAAAAQFTSPLPFTAVPFTLAPLAGSRRRRSSRLL